MRRILADRTMPLLAPAVTILCAVAVVGCVSTGTHTKTLTELEAEKKTSAQLQQQSPFLLLQTVQSGLQLA